MHFREYLLNEYAFYTHKTQDTHSNVNTTRINKSINIDDILMSILKKVVGNKEIHILHKDNKFSKKHHEIVGKKPKQCHFNNLSHHTSEYFDRETDDDSYKRKFRLEISDYYIIKGKEAVKTLMQRLNKVIEEMFKKLGFATLVKINADDELMNVNVVLSHHTKNLNFKSLLSKL